MRRRPPTLRHRILELLADGLPHRSDHIARALHLQFGFSEKTTTAALSFFANYRGIRREKDGAFYVYRRVDVERAA
jgi:hypothetical protein